jgi:hypothetical protein
MFYVDGIIWHFEFLKPTYADGVRFVVLTLEYVVLETFLRYSESGQPKLLLYDRAPSSAFMISSIRLTATFPLSTGALIIDYVNQRIPVPPPYGPTQHWRIVHHLCT